MREEFEPESPLNDISACAGVTQSARLLNACSISIRALDTSDSALTASDSSGGGHSCQIRNALAAEKTAILTTAALQFTG